MKILHCVRDDKFTDGTIRVYENDSRHQNKYLLFTSNVNRKIEFIKYPKLVIAPFKSFLTKASEYDVIILHSFNVLPPTLICKIPKKCKVVWYGWGTDIYTGQPPFVDIKLFNTETEDYLQEQNKTSLYKRFKFAVAELYYGILRKKALERIDFFSGVFPYEYDLIKKYQKSFCAKPLDFYYGDTDFFVKETYDRNVEKGKINILIGNSNDPANNHHDALTLLSKVTIPEGTKIIMPLSYGGTQHYADWIINYGKKLFGDQFTPLRDFMPLDKYLNLISKCRVAVFFHERQQASDNIFIQIMYGAKVYMSETSLAFKYLKSIGFAVFSLQKDIGSLMEELPDDVIVNNRRLLSELYSSKTIKHRVININDIIENEIAQ